MLRALPRDLPDIVCIGVEAAPSPEIAQHLDLEIDLRSGGELKPLGAIEIVDAARHRELVGSRREVAVKRRARIARRQYRAVHIGYRCPLRGQPGREPARDLGPIRPREGSPLARLVSGERIVQIADFSTVDNYRNASPTV